MNEAGARNRPIVSELDADDVSLLFQNRKKMTQESWNEQVRQLGLAVG
jgi:hypothetical protein